MENCVPLTQQKVQIIERILGAQENHLRRRQSDAFVMVVLTKVKSA
jgi:hypothetical protein